MGHFDELRISDDCCSEEKPSFSCRVAAASEQSALLFPRYDDPDSFEERLWVV